MPDQHERLADVGLLVIHGVGPHRPTVILRDVVDPMLRRLRAQGKDVTVEPTRVGTEQERGGSFEALRITYPAQNSGPSTRTLLAVEGRWYDIFVRPGQESLSAWTIRNATRLAFTLGFYYSRLPTRGECPRGPGVGLPAVLWHYASGWLRFIFSVVAVSLLLLALWQSGRDGDLLFLPDNWALLLGLGLGIGLLVTLFDYVQLGRGRSAADTGGPPAHHPGVRDWLLSRLSSLVCAISAVAMLFIFQIERVLTCLVAWVGACVLPVAAVLLRILASIPFLSTISAGVFRGLEAALLTGNVSDMEGIANNHLRAAEVLSRVRHALRTLEQGLKPGAVIVIVAHSAGTIPAWWALTEDEIHERNDRLESWGRERFHYRLFTVGPALNWALRGFDYLPAPLTNDLVNSGVPGGRPDTLWMNVYGSFDFIPHGPIEWQRLSPGTRGCSRLSRSRSESGMPRRSRLLRWLMGETADELKQEPSWRTLDGRDDPNVVTRNLGAPVPDEHGEYWVNQQEFVPLLWNAFDGDGTSDGSADPQNVVRARRTLWSNCRLALIASLARVRLVLLAMPIAAIVFLQNGHDIYAGVANCTAAGDSQPTGVMELAKKVAGQSTLDYLCEHTDQANAVIVVVLFWIAYMLMDIYTSVCWQSLGRRARFSVEDTTRPPRWRTVPRGAAVWVWLPSMLVLPVVLYLFGANLPILVALSAVNVTLTLGEIWWVYQSLRAIATGPAAASSPYARALGRHRSLENFKANYQAPH